MDMQDPGNMNDPQSQPGASGPGGPMPQPGPYSPQPQPGPYQPPQQPGAYQPPQQPGQPYQPPQQYPPQGYPPQPYGAAPPPSDGSRKGFNWIACCGISCGAIILISVIVGVFFWKMIQPFVGVGLDMKKITEEIQATDITTIESEATALGAEELAANPDQYMDTWVVVTGEVMDVSPEANPGAGASEMPNTPYMLKPGVFVMDMSVAPAVGGPGAVIEAAGKIVQMDLSKMPFVGKMIEEEMKKDPTLSFGPKMTFIIAKQVTLIEDAPAEGEAGTDAGGETPADGAADAAGGWQNP